MSDIDQQFIEYVVKSLVGKPEAVHIDRRVDEKGVLLELTVDPEDLGRVIGKRGATAQSLRTLLRALGTKNDARYNLKIMDNGVGASQTPGSNDSPAAVSDNATNATSSVAADSKTSDDSATVTSPQTEPLEAGPPAYEPQAQAPSQSSLEENNASTTVMPEDQTSDRLRQTRAELADLDDLDV